MPIPKPRIIFISRKWPPAIGGMETYALRLSEELGKRADLDVWALPGREDGRPPRMHRLPGFMLSSLLSLWRRRADVVHVGDLVLWPLAWAALLRKTAPRVVMTAYGLDLVFGRRPGLLSRVYRSYLALGVRLTGRRAGVIAISRFTAKLCEEAGFRNVSVVTLGVAPPGPPAGSGRDAGAYVLFVGRLVPRKGAAWFATEVLPRLPADTRFVVVGKGWDDNERKALQGNPRIDYHEYVSTAQLRVLRRDAVAVVMPNRPSNGRDVEGFGLTAIEAAADGGVLLASGIEGLTDAVIDGETGFLLSSEDADAWVTKIENIRSWPASARASFVDRAQRTIVDRFSWSTVAENTLDAYRISS